eukprot:3511974-Rhodomonas_salina.1
MHWHGRAETQTREDSNWPDAEPEYPVAAYLDSESGHGHDHQNSGLLVHTLYLDTGPRPWQPTGTEEAELEVSTT